MNKINPYYIVKTAFTKRAETMSMPFTPNNAPTHSLYSLTGATPLVNNNPWKTTMQHPGIPDINQRYSSKPYTSWDPEVPRPAGERHPGTGDTAEEHLNAIKDTDLIRFLLSRGYPTKQEPYIANVPVVPDTYYFSNFGGIDRKTRPDYGRVRNDLIPNPFTGHEAGHGADLNEKRDYAPGYNNYPKDGDPAPSSEILRRETMATLGQYAAMQKALKDSPDLFDRYMQLSAPTLIPALGTYYAQFLPNALREYGSITSGALNTLAGLRNPANWSINKTQDNFKKGQNIFNKILGSPKKEVTFQDMTPLQDILQCAFGTMAGRNIEKDIAKEQWRKLTKDLRNYAKQEYGFNNNISWYNPSLSPEENIRKNTQYYKPQELQFLDVESK